MISCLLALCGGAMLWVSQPPRHRPWLQIPALVALIFAIGSTDSLRLVALIGLCFALAYVGPQLVELRLTPVISAGLLVSQSVVWLLFALCSAHLADLKPLPFVVSIACLGTALMWLEWSLLPLWGTAQNFARGWSQTPQLVQFVALTGVAGLNWILFLVGAAFAQLLVATQEREALIWLLFFHLWPLAIYNVNSWRELRHALKFRVAAYGWDTNSVEDAVVLEENIVREAAQQGAKLLVTPEAAFRIENLERFRRTLQTLATRHHIALAIGYFDVELQENCIDFVSARGEIQGRYVKTHLVPVLEKYERGRGVPCLLQIEAVKVGGLICQDDNFTDIAGKYARSKTQILAVPTNDWAAVKQFHFTNSLWRALEYRMGMVRAASNGISAIVSPRGEIIASCDHFKEGPKLLVADLPIHTPGTTIYAILRDWLPIGCGLFVLWALLMR